jgi:hypothetical protein
VIGVGCAKLGWRRERRLHKATAIPPRVSNLTRVAPKRLVNEGFCAVCVKFRGIPPQNDHGTMYLAKPEWHSGIGEGRKRCRSVSAHLRGERDGLILRMFWAGSSYRQIARHPRIKLSHQAVGNVVRRELAADAPHREALSEQAASIYILRLERMLAAAMPQALQGDWRA